MSKVKLPQAILSLIGARGPYPLREQPLFLKQFLQFLKMGGNINVVEPILFEKTDYAGSANGHYFHQDLLVANLIHEASPQRHIDIGSRIDGFVAHVAAFRKVEVLDVRPLQGVGHANIEFKQMDLMRLDPALENACDSISCLHAIEHFGLGRYGDEINPDGHLTGFANMIKILKPGGRLYISFPIASESSVIFNKHRIFSPRDIFSWATPNCTLKLLRFDYVDDAGNLHQHVNLNTQEINARYACGIYTFEKLSAQNDGGLTQSTPQITFLMDPGNKEGAGSFYQRPFLASLVARSLGVPFVPANNPHSDCHYQSTDQQSIEADWEHLFGFLGNKISFPNALPNLDPDQALAAGQVYNAPFSLSYSYVVQLDAQALQALLQVSRTQFKDHLQAYPELLPPKEDGTVIALHLRDRSKGDPPFSIKTLLDWQMFSLDYGLPDNNPQYYSRLYAHAVNQIVSKYAIEKPILHIHSTGEEKSFKQLLSLLDNKVQVKLFLRTSPPQSFLDLVLSDYLIASHSSFSWLASLLHTGPTFIRGKFRHFVTPDTQIIEEVLYQHKNLLQKILISMRMKIAYFLFNKLN